MRILVTGGTGFVGSHTVAELVRRGHAVRLLVRDPGGIPRALASLGVESPPFVVGDVTDRAVVGRAMQGCDAVLHAAAVYSLDVRAADAMRRVNRSGTDTVLGAAFDQGLDPIVYVSSYAALFPPEGRLLTVRSPVKEPPGAYCRSKADAERVARCYQDRGAPVVISYPGGVFGPNDPHFGESARLLRGLLAGQMPVVPPGGPSVVDVRDLADAHAAMFRPGCGARRYMLSGTGTSLSDMVAMLAGLTGRRMARATLPAWSLRPGVRLADLLQRFLPIRLPVSREGFDVIAWNPRGDDTESVQDLGFHPRDVRETLADFCRWAYRAGWLTKRQTGKLAAES